MRERKPVSTEYLKVLVSDLKCDFHGERYREFQSAKILRSMSSVKWRLSPRGFSQALSHAVKLLPDHGWTAERRRGKHGFEYRFRRHEPAYDGPMMTPKEVDTMVANLKALSPRPDATTIPVSDVRKRILDILMGGRILDAMLKWLRELEG